jgi:membrane-bound lytic murein transglycosylase F
MGTVLVQKNRPEKVTNPKDLDNKVIYIQKDAIFKSQLCSLQNDLGIKLSVLEEKGNSDFLSAK